MCDDRNPLGTTSAEEGEAIGNLCETEPPEEVDRIGLIGDLEPLGRAEFNSYGSTTGEFEPPWVNYVNEPAPVTEVRDVSFRGLGSHEL
jgi:hypothetical protein